MDYEAHRNIMESNRAADAACKCAAEAIRERDEARAEVERLRGLAMAWADQIEDGWKHGDPALFVISITEMRKEGEKR